jgi:hypothetical protein
MQEQANHVSSCQGESLVPRRGKVLALHAFLCLTLHPALARALENRLEAHAMSINC